MRILSVFIFLFSFVYTEGQSLGSMTLKAFEASDSAAKLYFFNQHETLPIYNGRFFYGYPGTKDHAFYPETGWQNGSVLYDGAWYHGISLMYDIYKDELVIQPPNSTAIRLFSERVQQFIFRGETFVRLHADKNNVLKTGFYQRLAEGNVALFAKRSKKLEENIVDRTIERRFVSLNQYYVLKDSNYYLIKKQKSLLALLKDSRQNIVQHLKQQQLRYKDNKEKTIVQIAEFYNQSHK